MFWTCYEALGCFGTFQNVLGTTWDVLRRFETFVSFATYWDVFGCFLRFLDILRCFGNFGRFWEGFFFICMDIFGCFWMFF